MTKAILDDKQVLFNIGKAFEELSGNEIAEIHNQICAKKIQYDGDDVWSYTGEDDNPEMLQLVVLSTQPQSGYCSIMSQKAFDKGNTGTLPVNDLYKHSVLVPRSDWDAGKVSINNIKDYLK